MTTLTRPTPATREAVPPPGVVECRFSGGHLRAIARMLGGSAATGRLAISGPDRRGRLLVRAGRVVAATGDETLGLRAAARRLLEVETGEFRFLPGAPIPAAEGGPGLDPGDLADEAALTCDG